MARLEIDYDKEEFRRVVIGALTGAGWKRFF
jgi:hypothetical protein